MFLTLIQFLILFECLKIKKKTLKKQTITFLKILSLFSIKYFEE